MCVVSAVTDHFREQWPVPPFWNPAYDPFKKDYPVITPGKVFEIPATWPAPIIITPEQWADYQRLKAAAEEIDRLTGQPDCVKEGVPEWEAAVRATVYAAPPCCK